MPHAGGGREFGYAQTIDVWEIDLIMRRTLALMEPSLAFKLRQSAPGNPQYALLRFAENVESGFNCKPIAHIGLSPPRELP